MKLVKVAHAAANIQLNPQNTVNDFGKLISALITASIVIGALAALTFLIIGGFQWITSGGDKVKTESAQKHITNAIIGLVIIAAAYAITRLITQFLGVGDISNLQIKSVNDF